MPRGPPKSTKRLCNQPDSKVSHYRQRVSIIIDAVRQGFGERPGASRDDLRHEQKVAIQRNIANVVLHSDVTHELVMNPGEKEQTFHNRFGQLLAKYNDRDHITIMYSGARDGLFENDYRWVFRGDGPRSIDAYKFIDTVNNADSDCLVILECLIPDRLENKWSFDGRMTEIVVSGNNDSDSNFFETIDGSCGSYASAPPANTKSRRSLPELFAKDYSISTNTRRVWLKKTKEGCKDLIQRFAIDPEQVRRDNHLQFVAVEIQGPNDPDPVDFSGGGSSGDGDDGEDGEDGDGSDDSEDDADAPPETGDEDENDDDDDDDDVDDDGDGDDDLDAVDDDEEDPDEVVASLERRLEAAKARSRAAKGGLGKRKRDSHQAASSQAPRQSQESSPDPTGRDVTPSSHRDESPIAVGDGNEDEEALFVSQSGSRNSPISSIERTEREEMALGDNGGVDQEVVDQVEENYTLGMDPHAGPNGPGPSEGKKSTMPRLGGLLNFTPRRGPTSSPNPVRSFATPDWVARLPTSAHDSPSRTLEGRLSKRIKKSSSPISGVGGGSRLDRMSTVKREKKSPFFGLGRGLRFGSVSSIKREILDDDDDDTVITGFRSKIIDPAANGELVDLTLDD